MSGCAPTSYWSVVPWGTLWACAFIRADEIGQAAMHGFCGRERHNETAEKNFLAQDQNIWGAGAAFSIDQDFFLGPNVPLDANFGVETTSGHLKAGLSAEILSPGWRH